jgi:hypothetical protein
MSASAVGAAIAAPTPCMPRVMMSHTSDCAKPPSSDEMAKTVTPIMNMRRLPYRSPVRPPNNSSPPKVNEYPVMSHSRFANEKCKAW